MQVSQEGGPGDVILQKTQLNQQKMFVEAKHTTKPMNSKLSQSHALLFAVRVYNPAKYNKCVPSL